MNIIDVILVLVIILSIWRGYQKGFLLGLLEMAGWLGSLLLTFLSYPYVVRWLDERATNQSVWLLPLVFIGCFFVIRLIIGALINLILSAVPEHIHKSGVNRTTGIIPGLLNGLIYAAILATILLIVPLSDQVSSLARDSMLATKFTEPVAKVEEKLSPVFEDAVKRTIGKMTVDNSESESEKFVKLHYTVKEPEARPDLEAQMLVMVNEERVKQGLKPVVADPEMTAVARKHSTDMFARGYFSHFTPEGKDPFDRMKADKVKFLAAGENLALARNVRMAHEGLMNSPGHRENILRPTYGRLGIGIMDGGIYGIMVTQNFRN